MALAPVIPVLTVASVEDGLAQAKALVAGGLYAIEVTLRTPPALEAIEAIAKNVPKARRRRGHRSSRPTRSSRRSRPGAKFLVSPGAPAALAKAAAESPVPFLPGCATASEAMALARAWLPGAETLSRRGGRGREATRLARRAPARLALLPDRRHRSSRKAPEYLKLPNVPCVGGSWMLQKAALAAGDYLAVEALARDAAGLDSARPRSPSSRARHPEMKREAHDLWIAPLGAARFRNNSAKLEAIASGCENRARQGPGHRDDFPTYPASRGFQLTNSSIASDYQPFALRQLGRL